MKTVGQLCKEVNKKYENQEGVSMTNDICSRVKDILSRRSPEHPPVATIKETFKLKGTQLQFDDAGRRALAKTITDEILKEKGKKITLKEMDEMETVGQLCDEVNKKYKNQE